MGRLLNGLFKFTASKRTHYIEKYQAFYNVTTRNADITLTTINLLRSVLGAGGLHGMDRLISYRISREMKSVHAILDKLFENDKKVGKKEYAGLGSLNNVVEDVEKLISPYKKRNEEPLLIITKKLENIGTLTIVRKLILQELNVASRTESEKLFMLIENINESVLNDSINMKYKNPGAALSDERKEADNLFLQTLSSIGLRIGLSDPLMKVYHQPIPIEPTPFMLFAAISLYLPMIGYNEKLDCLFRKNSKSENDPIRLVYGLAITLYQYGDKATKQFFHYMAQYVKSSICRITLDKKEMSMPLTDKFVNTFYFSKLYEDLAHLCGFESEVGFF